MSRALRLSAMGMVNALGADARAIWARVLKGEQGCLRPDERLHPGRSVLVGRVRDPLPAVPEGLGRYDCRNNALALCALSRIAEEVRSAVERWGPDRVGVVAGTSTSGMAETEDAYAAWRQSGELPPGFACERYDFGGLAEALARRSGISGPAYSISTACSSSAKVLASARALIRTGVCDAVLAGGADSLCKLTVQGFGSLGLLSETPCNPMSRNRSGLNIGEGAALFLLTREPGGIQLLGVGETSDAHHMSAPDPEGKGAAAAMEAALRDAELEPKDIDYVNLHGTGTPLNDAMESAAVARLLPGVPASSSKPLVGHCLGAAGAVELGICWLALARAEGGRVMLPPHRWDGELDDGIPALPLVEPGDSISADDGRAVTFLSNSFGFGGNNCSVIMGLR